MIPAPQSRAIAFDGCAAAQKYFARGDAEARRSSQAEAPFSLRSVRCRGALRAPVAPCLGYPGFVGRRARAARPYKRFVERVSANLRVSACKILLCNGCVCEFSDTKGVVR
jgi:hypothetical protein